MSKQKPIIAFPRLPPPSVADTGGPLGQALGAMAPGLKKIWRVLTEEARNGWWSDDMTIGHQTVRQRYPLTLDQNIPVLNVEQFGIPQVMTIALSREPIDLTGIIGDNCDVFARVRYGLGAFTDTFEVDWANSIQFSVVASTLTVDALPQVVDLSIPYAAPATAELLLGGASGKFPAPNALPPTRTYRVARFPGGIRIRDFAAVLGAAAQAPVPPFSRAISLQSGVTATGGKAMDPGARVEFLDLAGSLITFYTFDELLVRSNVPIPGDTFTVRVEQTAFPYAPDLQINYRLIFHLGL